MPSSVQVRRPAAPPRPTWPVSWTWPVPTPSAAGSLAPGPPRPRSYPEAIIEFEALADDRYTQALADGQVSERLSVWDSERDYWAAVPAAAQQATPAALHRVAEDRAAAILRDQGVDVRIVPGAPLPREMGM